MPSYYTAVVINDNSNFGVETPLPGEQNGRTCAVIRSDLASNRCPSWHSCRHCSHASGKYICTIAARRFRSVIEDWNTHVQRAISSGHIHRCTDNRYYAMSPVLDGTRTFQPHDYYSLPTRDYGLKAENCPCGAHRRTVTRYTPVCPEVNLLSPGFVITRRPRTVTEVIGLPGVVFLHR